MMRIVMIIFSAGTLAAAQAGVLADSDLDGWNTRIEAGVVTQRLLDNDIGGLANQTGIRLGMMLGRPEWRVIRRIGVTWTSTSGTVSEVGADYDLDVDTVAFEASSLLAGTSGVEWSASAGPALRRIDYVSSDADLGSWVPAVFAGTDVWLKAGRTWAVGGGVDLCLAGSAKDDDVAAISGSSFGLRLAFAWTY
jgi:hypothetical protein